MAAPNDGYLLLYLSYLGFAWRGDDCMGVYTTPTYGGHYGILSPWGLDYTLYIGGGMFHRGPPIGIPYRDLYRPYREIWGIHRCAYLRPTS